MEHARIRSWLLVPSSFVGIDDPSSSFARSLPPGDIRQTTRSIPQGRRQSDPIGDPVFGSINDLLQPLPPKESGRDYDDGLPSWANATPGQILAGETVLKAGGGVQSEGAFKLRTGHGQFYVEITAPTPQLTPAISRRIPLRVQKDTVVQIGFTTMRAGTSDRKSFRKQFWVGSGERKRFSISLPRGHNTVGGTIFSVPGTMQLTNVAIYI